ncbi:MAG TPA: DUF2179 domain-containing protein [candidate division Zixibacteria bacterium]|nr:DUF2179 domain-containing protein [candidate division Zixibacteria bacterium]
MENLLEHIGPFVPVLIFLARIADVSLGTLRMITVVRGYTAIATGLAFLEIIIWLTAIGQVMQNLTSWAHYVAYAGGFAAGTFVGMLIERRLSLGTALFRIVTRKEADDLTQALIDKGYVVTHIDAESNDGAVKVIYVIVKRRRSADVIAVIRQYNPLAFYTIEDLRFVSDPLPAALTPALRREYAAPFRWFRKGV